MKIHILAVLTALTILVSAGAQNDSGGRITGEQGKTVLFEVASDVNKVELTRNGQIVRDALVFRRDDRKYALLALALEDKNGNYKLLLHGTKILEQGFIVLQGKYKTSRSSGWNTPPPLRGADAERVAKERAAMQKAYENGLDFPVWLDGSYRLDGFVFPLQNCCAQSNISSPFGQIRIGTKRSSVSRRHRGIDLRAPEGTPIFSVARGRVAYVGKHFLDGGITIIDHGAGVFSLYLHQSSTEVSAGDFVAKGDRIGRVGKTGIASGPNLHLEIRIDGTHVSPLDFIELFQ
ncbi:MAG: M23 family metallopeptidase [Candidatus Liptonbacteria bacterium]|nr:M23 family metallopeptidase [Candidatus Liptonbacteria bacterium]